MTMTSFEQYWVTNVDPILNKASLYIPAWLANIFRLKSLGFLDIWLILIPGYLFLRKHHSKWIQSKWLHPIRIGDVDQLKKVRKGQDSQVKYQMNPKFFTFTLPSLIILGFCILGFFLGNVYFQNEFIQTPLANITSPSGNHIPSPSLYLLKRKLVQAKQNRSGSPEVDWNIYWDPMTKSDVDTRPPFDFTSLPSYEFESLLFLDYHIGYDFQSIVEFFSASGENGRWVYLGFLIIDTLLSFVQWAFNIQLIFYFFGIDNSSVSSSPYKDDTKSKAKKEMKKSGKQEASSPIENNSIALSPDEPIPILAFLFSMFPTILCLIEIYENLGHGIFLFYWSWAQLMSTASFRLSKPFVHRVMTASSWKFSLWYLLLGIHMSGYIRKFVNA